MKKTFFVLFMALFFAAVVFAQPQTEEALTVYAYDSFLGEWGPGEGIVEAFEKATGIKVNLVGVDGAVELYSKVLYEGEACPADIVLGLSDTMNVDSSIFVNWKPSCEEDLAVPSKDGLIPFDYGIFAFIGDTEYFKTHQMPTSLEDLTKSEYKDKVILIDPRTSSVGLGLLTWTIEALGEEKAFQWWKDMSSNALTIGSSWSSSYGLFTEGEAPLVISYTTSPIYHVMYEDTTRFQALEFTNGHIQTIEYMGILKSSKNIEKAKAFIEFILTEGQEDIAVCNTMFPSNTKVELPDAFQYALKTSVLSYDTEELNNNMSSYLDRWALVMVK